MKCAIFKINDGRALVGMICNEQGIVIDPNISAHLDSVVTENNDLVSWRITDHLDLPGGHGNDRFDNTFKGAFTDELVGSQVDIDLPKAKEIAHAKRRIKRSEEYKVYDGDNMYVSVAPTAQIERDNIKARYDQVQINLDNAVDISSLKAEMIKEGLI